jgi:TIR domain-containing protein
MARVFISHAHEDRKLAACVREWLVADGHETFLDQDPDDGIAVGELWEARLYDRLRWADAMVCLITSAYVASPWCSAEIAIFRWERGRLLPFVAECALEHPLLRSLQGADYTVDPVRARVALLRALCSIDTAGRRHSCVCPSAACATSGVAHPHRSRGASAAHPGAGTGLAPSP